MSEYQYYEWQTVDRLLTDDAQEAVNRLSSHIDVSASRAVVTYEYGDFKHRPKEVLARYFDAHLYMANWGSRCLMFRFPKSLVEQEELAAYAVKDMIGIQTKGDYLLLTIDTPEQDGFGWIECEGLLSSFLPLREAILQADYRVLYLAWLKALSLTFDPSEDTPDQLEPPVPAGLAELSSALKRFVKLFDIPDHLLRTGARTSPELSGPKEIDFRSLIPKLTRQECDDFLSRVATADPTASRDLKKRLLAFVPEESRPTPKRRTVGDLFRTAEALLQKEERHRKEAVRKKHVAEMDDLAKKAEEVWQQVESMIQMKTIQQYDAAVAELKRLKALAEYQKRGDPFRQRLAALCDRYRRLSGLQHRVRQADIMSDANHSPDVPKSAC